MYMHYNANKYTLIRPHLATFMTVLFFPRTMESYDRGGGSNLNFYGARKNLPENGVDETFSSFMHKHLPKDENKNSFSLFLVLSNVP